ncbi:site-specific integrase [Psychrosphaera sp. F3M07]|uniref:site-specific integrase n=1 Tax=Psychrosphaera sp. F3M07 TaxID=2841560 RepID=UPI001C09EA58|nr:site-specific integrase [Psychrosphaera sp. F3M07]MBU2919150.1 site-specific integrase [Psychrosphaera sp. F3M07]
MQRFFENKVNGHYLYLNDNNVPILLPCLFARYTRHSLLSVYRTVEQNTKTGVSKHLLIEKEIGEQTAYKICNRLGIFLEYIDDYKDKDFISLNTHTALPSEVINDYINDYLINERGKSEQATNKYVEAINSYYNWLSYYFNNKPKYIGIKSNYRKIARNNTSIPLLVNYFLPATRELLYANCSSLLQQIVLRNAGELGCRTAENLGFLLDDFKANKREYTGLRSLFKQLKKNPEQEEFKYHLNSIWTKYSRSRTLYIPRHLLKLMCRYYEQERPKSDSPHLFVSNSNQNRGDKISTQFSSDTFLEIKNKVQQKISKNPKRYDDIQEIHSDYSYHVMRHSFATDIFYNLCQGQNKSYESITTTSAVYIETARRMGHKVDARGGGDVTKRYIHSCGYRDALQKGVVCGLA